MKINIKEIAVGDVFSEESHYITLLKRLVKIQSSSSIQRVESQ